MHASAGFRERRSAPHPSSAPRVLVTGASGFIGSALVHALGDSFSVIGAYRTGAPGAGSNVVVGDLGPRTDWRGALEGVSAVVHTAGPAHANFPADELRRAIVDRTVALAEQAAKVGVQKFVYISSTRACAAASSSPLSEDTPPNPTDPYGRAKLEAEQALLSIAGGRVLALRPPLVVGAAAKGNFGAFLRVLDTAAPLPLGGLRSKRNIISLPSLCEAVRIALVSPPGWRHDVFHVADQPAVTVGEMAGLLRRGMGRPARLFATPGLSLIAPRQMFRDFEIDDRRFRATFGFAGQDAREALVMCGRAWSGR